MEFILYLLIIVTVANFTASWPISKHKHDINLQELQASVLPVTRFGRQVVQPTWLNFGQEPVVDPTVVINEQALMEAEEIRTTIQKAVKDDTFAVDDKQQNTNTSIQSFSTTTSPGDLNVKKPGHGFSNWYLRMRQLWRGWAQNLFKRFRN